MAVIKPQEIQTEEERHEVIADAFLNDTPSLPGIKCVRDITPLVMVALQRANNPYVTGQKGFDAAGISLESMGKPNTDDQKKAAVAFAVAMMPKTAEVLVLLSCSRDELKQFARSPEALENAALDFVDGSSMEGMAAATTFIAERLQGITKSRVTNSPEEEKPSAGPLEDTGPKKPAPTG